MSNRKILLRFDDICPTMNWTQWNKAKVLLDKVGVKPMLGIVPDNYDPELQIDEPREDFWEYIKELQQNGYTIAMHGYHHKFELKADGIVTKYKISEFAGLPYDVQLEKIRKGKDLMKSHGVETDIFFAPAHSYDDNTLRALAVCGFRYVSDGMSSRPYVSHGIKLIPCRSGGIPTLRINDDYITAVIHAHEWVYDTKVHEWIKFVNLIENHANEIVPFDVFCKWENGNFVLQRFSELFYLNIVIGVIKPLYGKLVKLIGK